VVYALIVFYTIWATNRRKGELSTYIEELTINVDSAAKNTLINSPFPIIVLETNGKVIWRSSTFNNEFIDVNINEHIDITAKEMKVELETNPSFKLDKKIEIDNRVYRVIGSGVKTRQKDKKKISQHMIMIYFVNITEEEKLLKKYEDTQTCVGMIMIDNFEEAIQRLAAEEKPGIIAAIEKELYEWATQTGGVMIKTERDTFVYVFDQKYLEEMREEKFSILDKVKEIETPEQHQLTLTIAISAEGNSNHEKYESALTAMDLALGRGGDQAVLRKDEKYYFFGGKSQEVEKRTRVKARVIANALDELISEASNVMIMGHANGDMDSFGASLGLYRLAKTFEKEAYIVQRQLRAYIRKLYENDRREGRIRRPCNRQTKSTGRNK